MKDLMKIHTYDWLPIFDFLDYNKWKDWFDNTEEDNVDFKIENGKAIFEFKELDDYSKDDCRLEYDNEFLKLFLEKKTKNSKSYTSYFYKIDADKSELDNMEAVFENGTLVVSIPIKTN